MPSLPAPSLSIRKGSGLLDKYEALAKFAAAIVAASSRFRAEPCRDG